MTMSAVAHNTGPVTETLTVPDVDTNDPQSRFGAEGVVFDVVGVGPGAVD
jgi:hypothetical protein